MCPQNFWHTPLCLAPHTLRPWLCARDSLTARLRKTYGSIQVHILRECWQTPLRDELEPLKLKRPKTHLAVRDVLLCCEAMPRVFAHSLATRGALRQGFRLLSKVGNKPLGAALFADPNIRRLPLSWCRIDARHPLWRKASVAGPQPRQLWARRSVFLHGSDRLLVTEVFLPPQPGT